MTLSVGTGCPFPSTHGTWQRSSRLPALRTIKPPFNFFGENNHENPRSINGSASAPFAEFPPGQCRHIQLTVRCATHALSATGTGPVPVDEGPFYAYV